MENRLGNKTIVTSFNAEREEHEIGNDNKL